MIRWCIREDDGMPDAVLESYYGKNKYGDLLRNTVIKNLRRKNLTVIPGDVKCVTPYTYEGHADEGSKTNDNRIIYRVGDRPDPDAIQLERERIESQWTTHGDELRYAINETGIMETWEQEASGDRSPYGSLICRIYPGAYTVYQGEPQGPYIDAAIEKCRKVGGEPFAYYYAYRDEDIPDDNDSLHHISTSGRVADEGLPCVCSGDIEHGVRCACTDASPDVYDAWRNKIVAWDNEVWEHGCESPREDLPTIYEEVDLS
jgi:hypothetical protein